MTKYDASSSLFVEVGHFEVTLLKASNDDTAQLPDVETPVACMIATVDANSEATSASTMSAKRIVFSICVGKVKAMSLPALWMKDT